MKKFLLWMLAVVMVSSSGLLPATEIIPLPDLVNPHTIKVDKTRLYITSSARILIYSIPQYTHIKTFGQEGMGPGEFNSYTDTGVQLDVQSDLIFVNSQNRVSYFNKSGKYLREKRTTKGWWHMPFKQGYIGLGNMREEGFLWRSVNIFDKDFNLIKRIGRKPHWFQPGKSIDPTDVRPPRFCVYKDRAYVENSKGVIDIFDVTGKHLFSTTHSIERRQVSEQDKQEYHEYYKTHRVYKTQYHNLKHLLKFPVHHPPIKHFEVTDDKIYLFTHVTRKGKSQLLIFDLNGQLIDNPDTEEMELHITPITK